MNTNHVNRLLTFYIPGVEVAGVLHYALAALDPPGSAWLCFLGGVALRATLAVLRLRAAEE